jgi:hypothetical protein
MTDPPELLSSTVAVRVTMPPPVCGLGAAATFETVGAKVSALIFPKVISTLLSSALGLETLVKFKVPVSVKPELKS